MVELTKWEQEALGYIEWWMRIHERKEHLGCTLSEALKTYSGLLRKFKVAKKPEEAYGVYAQKIYAQADGEAETIVVPISLLEDIRDGLVRFQIGRVNFRSATQRKWLQKKLDDIAAFIPHDPTYGRTVD